MLVLEGRQCIYIAREILDDTSQQVDTGIAGENNFFVDRCYSTDR